MSLLDFHKLHLSKEKYSALHEYALFVMSLSESTRILRADFFPTRSTHGENKIKTKILDKHLGNTLRT